MSLWMPYEPLDLCVRTRSVSTVPVHRPDPVSPVLHPAHRHVPPVLHPAHHSLPRAVHPAHRYVPPVVYPAHRYVPPVVYPAHRYVRSSLRQTHPYVPPAEHPAHQYIPPEVHPAQNVSPEVHPAHVPKPKRISGSSQIGPMSPPESLSDDGERKRKPFVAVENDSLSKDPGYMNFERDALRAMEEMNGGMLLGDNPRMRRAVQTNHNVDETYRQQREKNNVAAKQSRNRRRIREVKTALKVQYLQIVLKQLEQKLALQICDRCQKSIR